MKISSILLAAIFGAALTSGCRPFEPATPPGFVDMGDRYGNKEYRATTADGMVLGVRAEPNEPKGTVEFWTRVIENRMRETSGYALLSSRDVKNRAGQSGKQLRFGHDEGRVPHLYYVTVFTNDDYVFLLEAGGTKDLVEKHEEQINWSVQNFMPD